MKFLNTRIYFSTVTNEFRNVISSKTSVPPIFWPNLLGLIISFSGCPVNLSNPSNTLKRPFYFALLKLPLIMVEFKSLRKFISCSSEQSRVSIVPDPFYLRTISYWTWNYQQCCSNALNRRSHGTFCWEMVFQEFNCFGSFLWQIERKSQQYKNPFISLRWYKFFGTIHVDLIKNSSPVVPWTDNCQINGME